MKQFIGRTCVVAVALVAGFVGCRRHEGPPRELLGAAKMAVHEAERRDNTAQLAPADLQRAQQKVAEAERALESDRYTEARRLSEQAIVDAQLAQARTLTKESGMGATEARGALSDVRRGN